MSEPPKVLTAGGAARAATPAKGGNKKGGRGGGGNRRRKKKSTGGTSGSSGEAKQQQHQHAPPASATADADLLGTSDVRVQSSTKPTSSTAGRADGGGGEGPSSTVTATGGGRATRKRGANKAATATAAAAASSATAGAASSSPPRRGAGGGGGGSAASAGANPRRSPDNNPQGGSPPSPPNGLPPPSDPVVLVAGGGAKGGGGGGSGAERNGSRRSENRLPGEGKAGPRGGRRGSHDDDGAATNDDVEAFLDDDQDGDDAERHIGELDPSPKKPPVTPDDLYGSPPESPPPPHPSSTAAQKSRTSDLLWLLICFLGIMGSFVVYGLLLEYTTSGGRKLHELSFLFVTSGLYTVTAAAGRYVRQETPTSIPPARFAVLGLTSMGSTFCSVRSLRYVIYPIQVLAKSCKPVPVMLMGALMGKRYPLKKYVNVLLIVAGVGLFMGGGSSGGKKKGGGGGEEEMSSSSQVFGILLLFVSLCFDGGTGAYEDKLMSVHSVQPFDLMYNIQLGKTILAGVGLLVLNQVHVFLRMCQEMGFLLVALGLSGAMGQVFIFVTIAKFGALTCSIIGLARKVTTLVASIYFYGHELNGVQFTGLVVAVGSMVMNFWGKSGKKGGGHGHGHGGGGGGKDLAVDPEETKRMLLSRDDQSGSAVTDDSGQCDIELGPVKGGTRTIS